MMKRIFALIIAVCILTTGLSFSVFAEEGSATTYTATSARSGSEEEAAVSANDAYYFYLLEHADAETVTDSKIDIDLADVKLQNAKYKEYYGEDAIVIEQTGKVTFDFKVKKAGFYSINTRYAAVKGKPINMEVAIYVDGKIPYTEATTVTFSRIWKDVIDSEDAVFPAVDDSGNQLTPDVEEVIRYADYVVHDNDYMTDADLLFYFDKGEHTVTIESTRESIAFSKISLGTDSNIPTYDEYISQYEDVKVYDGETVEIAAELATERSEQSLTMVADYSNASTTPADPFKVCLNTIGGESWLNPGQWVAWEIDVPQTGKYALSFKYRQDYVSGFKVYRQVMVDGVVPCQEMQCVAFAPNTNWDNCTMGDAQGNPYYLYLEEGKHTLKLKVVLGPVSNSLQVISNSISDLNSIYRKIIGITGPDPDTNRDYDIDRVIPNLMEDFQKIYDDLNQIGSDIVEYNGAEGGLSSFISVMTNQIGRFIEDPLEIPAGLSGFKTNISSLADMMTDMKSQALLLDSIYLGSEENIPDPTVNVFKSTWFSIEGFFLSFVSDYNALGETYENSDVVYDIDEPIEVWMTSGRDQMNVLKTLIDDEFVAKYNIPVNLSLVDAGAALTKAILAGIGPDCALWLGSDSAITYSMRGALEDMDQFNAENQYDDDGNKKYQYTFEEVYDWFHPSAFICLEYLDDKVYGLPQSQAFKMMFIRDDVFAQLGLTAPKTWEDVYSIVTTIERNNMQIGIPSQDWNMFATLLLQNNNDLYLDDFSGVDLSTFDAIDAFEQWTDFNAKYSLPLSYDALNRFRSGEMPILLNDYSFYNNLSVGAPEIKGLWSMYMIPGTVQDDGSINTSQVSSGAISVMIKGCENKEAVWDFMTWWSSGKIQGTFGQKIEARLGAGGRYTTANIEGFDYIAWSVNEQASLKTAWAEVSDIRKIPGDYYVTRMINNAFRAVVYNNMNAREALIKYSKEMNKEIQRKREEYNIDSYFENKE